MSRLVRCSSATQPATEVPELELLNESDLRSLMNDIMLAKSEFFFGMKMRKVSWRWIHVAVGYYSTWARGGVTTVVICRGQIS